MTTRDAVIDYEPIRPVTRRRALLIGIWLGWGIDSIVTDLWPWLTGHTVQLGIRDLAVAGVIWLLAYAKSTDWRVPTLDEFRDRGVFDR